MKPREWVLNIRDGLINGPDGIVHFKGYAPLSKDVVHVIEYSAFIESENQYSLLRESFDELFEEKESAIKERDEARALLSGYERAAKIASDTIETVTKERDDQEKTLLWEIAGLVKERDEARAELKTAQKDADVAWAQLEAAKFTYDYAAELTAERAKSAKHLLLEQFERSRGAKLVEALQWFEKYFDRPSEEGGIVAQEKARDALAEYAIDPGKTYDAADFCVKCGKPFPNYDVKDGCDER